MGTKRTLIVEKGALRIQTETRHSTIDKNYVGELEDLFFGDKRIDIDKIIYNVPPEEQKELDATDKELDKIFSPTRTKNITSNKRRVQKRKSKLDTFKYDDTQYIKIKNLFVRVFPDDFSETISSSTYYKYLSRYDNEA